MRPTFAAGAFAPAHRRRLCRNLRPLERPVFPFRKDAVYREIVPGISWPGEAAPIWLKHPKAVCRIG